MKYLQVYSESKYTDDNSLDLHIDVYTPDYAEHVPQDAPSLIRLARQVNSYGTYHLENIKWFMSQKSGAKLIRESISMFDEYVKRHGKQPETGSPIGETNG